jgi:hypothetical protein
MELKCVELPADGASIHVSMGDFELLTPNGEHRVQILYRGEPPHGDSYHKFFIDDVSLPGYAWGVISLAQSIVAIWRSAGWQDVLNASRPW